MRLLVVIGLLQVLVLHDLVDGQTALPEVTTGSDMTTVVPDPDEHAPLSAPVRPGVVEEPPPPSPGDKYKMKLFDVLQGVLKKAIDYEQSKGFGVEPDSVRDLRRRGLLSLVLHTLFSILDPMKMIKEARHGMFSAVSCIGCHVLMSVVLVHQIFPKDMLASALTNICVTFKLNTEEICKDIIVSFEDQIDYIRVHTKLNSYEICGLLFSTKCGGYGSSNVQWTIDVPAKANGTAAKKPSKREAMMGFMGHSGPTKARLYRNDESTLDDHWKEVTVSTSPWKKNDYFAQITDIHIDPEYTEGHLATCGEPLCCRRGHEKAPNASVAGGHWGDYRACDCPLNLLNETLREISTTHNKARFWLWSGDFVPHNVWNVTVDEVQEVLTIATDIFKQQSGDKLVFPCLGNHDAVPVNGFAPPEVTDPMVSSRWLYDRAADEWSHWLPKEALKTFRVAGHYKVDIGPKLTLLNLNSNYCARLNPWIYMDPVDQGGQLKWFISELLAAENAGRTVHVMMHVPPDNRECHQAWLVNYVKIVDRFQDIITGQYFGHTHYDEFRVIYSMKDQRKAVGIQFLAPSVSPYSKTNPGFRLHITDDDGHLYDMHTYWLNLTEANDAKKNFKANWRLEYESREFYKLDSMRASEWNEKVLKPMKNKDNVQYNRFHDNYMSHTDYHAPETGSGCLAEDPNVMRDDAKAEVISDQEIMSAYVYGNKPFDFGR